MAGKHACSRCGVSLDDSTPDGYCLSCLLREGLGQTSEATPAGAGQRFGNYELIEKIGQGGMGVVYRARQINLDRIVAVKLLPFGQFSGAEAVRRFQAEASAAAGLQHPNIVAIHDVGEHEGQHYFSMDFIEGRTLAEVVRENPLPSKRAAAYLKTIAEAVHYAHEHGILHRDLKPSNILIDASDQPRITDFGLAKRLTVDSDLTLTGQVLGSPNFMAPEQAEGRTQAIGPATEVYALGALLYHLLTRQPPFQADTLTTLLKQVIETEPVPPRLLNPSVPRDLETICLKCLEKELPRRYPTAQALAEDLGRFLDDQPIQARPVNAVGQAWKWCRRQPVLAGLMATLIAVFVLGFGGVVWQWQRAKASELFARQNTYAADMNLAQRALEANDVRLAVSLLNEHCPGGKSQIRNQNSEMDPRGWEWRYLWQLCQPDESVRLQTNSGSIGEMAISHDGKVMAVQTGGDKIALWDLTTKRLITELPASPSIKCLRLSPAGNLLAVSIGGTRVKPAVEVWDVPARMIRATLAQPAPVRSLAFSPDETLLATFDDQGAVAVMDWAANHTLTNIAVPPARHNYAGVVDFSPDGSRLAIGEDYGRIRILNWRRGTLVAMTNLTQMAEGVGALAFSPSSELLATGFETTIRLWDARSGEPRGQWANPAGVIQALAFTRDGQRLASAGNDRTIRIWSVADQVELRHLQGHANEGMVLAFLPDGNTLASGCAESTVCFWDSTASHRRLAHTQLTIATRFDVFSHLEATDYAPEKLAPGVVRRFGFAFTPDSRSFVTSDPDGSLGVWDARTMQQKESLPALGSNTWGVALSPDGLWLAVGDAPEKVNVWSWTERRRVASFEVPFEYFGGLHFSRSGQFLWAIVVFNDSTTQFKLWRTADWQEVPLAGVEVADILWVDFSPDDRLLAAGYANNGAVKLWHFPLGQHETTFTNHQDTVWTVVFSPDGRRLASVSFDGTVRLRDLFTHREVATLRGHSSQVWGAAFSPDGRRLAAGGTHAREAVKLWDLATQRELLSLQAEGEYFVRVAFSPDRNTLAAVSFDGIAHLWHAPSWAEIEAAEKGAVAP